MIRTRTKLTVADYMATPEGFRGELLEGELFMSPSPGRTHQRVVTNIAERLNGFVRAQGLGEIFCAPFDCVLTDEVVVQPDVLFVSAAHLGKIRDRLHGAPDLAVEVLSPDSEVRDRIVKRDLYARHDVREYWIADPNTRTIEAMDLGAGAYRSRGVYGTGDILESPQFPGLRLEVGGLFD